MKFTLQPRAWYAMEYLFPSGERHCSPIWILGVTPEKTGAGWLELSYWHANYPEGVQSKHSTLRVLAREAGWLFAMTTHGPVTAGVIIAPITHAWLRLHFAPRSAGLCDRDELGSWLDRWVGRPDHDDSTV